MSKSINFLSVSSKKIKITATLIFFSLLILTIWFMHSTLKIPEEEIIWKYDDFVKEYSLKYGISPSLVYAVIKCESNFDEKAVSHAGASGLMQLMPKTFEWIIPELEEGETLDIFSPRQNIEAGCKYLTYLYKRFKVTETVLAAYNAGEGTVYSWLQNPEYSDDGITLKEIPYSETKIYVNKVMRSFEEYKNAEQ